MKRALLFLTVIGLLVAAIVYWVGPAHRASQEVAFTLAAVEWGSLTETVSATGQLAPRTMTMVSSQLPGQITRIYPNAEFNHFVNENEPLIELDPSIARVKLREAKAAVAASQVDVQRASAVRDGAQVAHEFQQSLSPEIGLKSQLEEARFKLKAANAALEAAQLKVKVLEATEAEAQIGLDKTVIRALAAGVIVDRKAVLGQMVGPQLPTPLFTIASDLSQLQIHAQVAESDLSKVREGQEATFAVYAYSETNERFDGKVQEIRYLPTNVQGAVFYTAVINAANRRVSAARSMSPQGLWMLRPGMTATVDIIIRKRSDVWKVPTDALNFQLEEAYKSDAARNKLERWQERADRDEWKPVWILDGQKKPWPIFVRIGGVNAAGQAGIKDSQFNEVLEWDPELKPVPQPHSTATYPRPIISAPPAMKPGILDRPNRIIS